jgi:long-chain acyl-CoA synthetase
LAIVEDEEQVDRLLEARDSSVERIFVADPRGIGRLEHPAASFEQLEALGSIEAVEFRADDVGFWERSVETLDLASIAAIAFTPGTTGTPKGVMLTQANLAAAAEAGVTAYGLRSGDRIVSCLPLAEITERVLVVAQATRAACTVHFGEGADALEQDVREVEPTVLLGAPRLWARFRDRIDDGLRDAGRLKRAAFRGAVAPRHRIGRVAGRLLVSGPLRRYAGLARVRVALVGGAPTPTDLVDWWARVGIGLRELYGLTESTGVGTVCGDADVATGSVGRPVPGVEIAIRDESTSTPGTGEVLLRGPVVCAAYLDDPEATRRFATDGWLHTGDVGALDDQQRLTIVDRVKDVIVLSAGHAVAPRPIERRLTSSPFMRTALVVGEGRSHLGALIDIDDQAVGDWAAERGAAYTTSETLRAVPEARELIGDVIEQLNLDLIEEERIQAFALLPDVLDVNGGMLTATAKVRREAITTRYAELVEAMYT